MLPKKPLGELQLRIEEASRANATSLYLGGLLLETLPESLSRLTHLLRLDLSRNKLDSLPQWLGDLTRLQRLDLSANQLQSVPESLGQLTHLQRLDLSGNRLVSLPESLVQLTELWALFLHGNVALGLPPEVLGPPPLDVFSKKSLPARPADILRYYFQKKREPTRHLNEAKILVVGQGAVGKTSLVKRLIADDFNANEGKTEGIAITRWQVTSNGGEEDEMIRLNIWDFGGQEIMHATHQFFLTKRSLYLLVLDARKGENESNIQYWLKIIQSYGGDAPVLVVVNKCEPPNILDLNENRLKMDFAPNVKGFFKVSCEKGSGIGGKTGLRAAIEKQVNALEHVHDALPESYFVAKEALERQSSNFIDYAEYKDICRTSGVPDDGNQQTLLRFLHDLGTVLNFGDPDGPYRLQDMNILKPQWVTGGVYKILNSNLLMQKQGVLDMAEVGDILGDPASYPPGRQRFIIDMMRKFELCFDFPDSKGSLFLVPELLSPNEPELNWDDAGSLNFQYHYSVLPGGIMSRFIVRMHGFLTKNRTCWRSGVVLEIDGNRALARADTQKGRLYIAVAGPPRGRRAALSAIRNTFRQIHATVPRLEAQEKVPLPDDPSVVVGYRHLLTLEEQHVRELVPEGSTRKYSVATLLDGIEDKVLRQEEWKESRPIPSGTRATKTLDMKVFLAVGCFFVFAFVAVTLTLATINVRSATAIAAIAASSLLFAIILFVVLGRFTGMLDKKSAERLMERVLNRIGLRKGGAESKRDDGTVGKKTAARPKVQDEDTHVEH